MGEVLNAIKAQVLSWPGTTAAPGRFGSLVFRCQRTEIGHMHGDWQADLPFPKKIRDQLVAAHKASAHHMFPDSGWVTRHIGGIEEVSEVVELFRLNYDRCTKRLPPITE